MTIKYSNYNWIDLHFTGPWSGFDTLANCNKVEHDKIWKYNGKLRQERRNFENLPKLPANQHGPYCPPWPYVRW